MSAAELPDLPIEHAVRPQPPWRTTALLTECGRPVDSVTVITRDQLIAKVKRQGQQRAAFTTCMVCWHKCRHNHAWDVDPVGCLMREAARYEHASRLRIYFGGNELRDAAESQRAADASRFRDELFAIAALIEAHRPEFDGYCEGLAATGNLTERRTARRAAQWRAKGSRQ
jgi:hypothetical protein